MLPPRRIIRFVVSQLVPGAFQELVGIILDRCPIAHVRTDIERLRRVTAHPLLCVFSIDVISEKTYCTTDAESGDVGLCHLNIDLWYQSHIGRDLAVILGIHCSDDSCEIGVHSLGMAQGILQSSTLSMHRQGAGDGTFGFAFEDVCRRSKPASGLGPGSGSVLGPCRLCSHN